MLIQCLHLPADEVNPIGLHEVHMGRLGRYVALAGKNGAGKSRLLKVLEEKIGLRNQFLPNLATLKQNIAGYEKALADGGTGHPRAGQWQQSMAQAKTQLELATNRVIADQDTEFKALRFVPKGLNLENPADCTSSALSQRSNNASTASVEAYSTCCLHYIQKLQNRSWSVTHPRFSGDSEVKQAAEDDYDGLNQLVTMLLGVELDRNSDDLATLFKLPLALAQLSDGQKVLLQLAVALHARKGDLNNTVFLLDEPENHLHPSAAISVLEKLDEAAPRAQIWIATHSVPLLAYVASVEPMAIWCIEDGKVTHSGRRPERVLRTLLGDEQRVGQVSEFTGLPALLATTTFAVESLLPPKTVGGQGGDPQLKQIAGIIEKKTGDRVLSVLDLGAGKGRLLEGIAAEIQGGEIGAKIDYFAFDTDHKDKNLCCAVIADLYGSAEDRYFNSEDNFFSCKDDHSIDVIIMCNVLHEIPPSQWVPLFSPQSLIARALKKDGFLLIVEDQRIPVGEKAHEHGFLILDTPQLKTLFSVTQADIKGGAFVYDDCRGDGRLKAHLIAAPLLTRVTAVTRTEAIRQLLEASLLHVKAVRGIEASYANGQLHGFWTQQLANAYIYTRENI